MNERIKKLKEQATSYTWNGNDVTEELDEQKFAELIVKECIELNKQELAFNAFERMLNRYKGHFGVEE